MSIWLTTTTEKIKSFIIQNKANMQTEVAQTTRNLEKCLCDLLSKYSNLILIIRSSTVQSVRWKLMVIKHQIRSSHGNDFKYNHPFNRSIAHFFGNKTKIENLPTFISIFVGVDPITFDFIILFRSSLSQRTSTTYID